ncbi:hypothetical protein NM604_0963 [Neisseria meningitidis NM604]|nr:hypothetical protein NM604_0963 [Neisseria meningitidis NM604]
MPAVQQPADGIERKAIVDGKPALLKFWQENGFDIKSEEPAIGQMETGNRAKISQDSIRRLFDTVGLGGIYSTGERDKFIIRIEQGQNGVSDIFFAHKAMKEVYGGKNKDTTVWQPSPSDPNLEAAFLTRFMQYLGVDGQQAENASAKKPILPAANEMARIEGKSLIVFGDWKLAAPALALDRIGLTVVGKTPNATPSWNPERKQCNYRTKPGLFKRLLGNQDPHYWANSIPNCVKPFKTKAASKQKLLFYAELFTTNGAKYPQLPEPTHPPKADRTHNALPEPPSIPLRERLSTAPTHSASAYTNHTAPAR